MNYAELRRNIIDLIEKYAPEGTTFAWDNATTRFGCCHYSYNRYLNKYYGFKITISYPLASRNTWDVVKLTVLHEIAHARAPGHNHDAVWRRECLKIGGDGKRCYTDIENGGNVNVIPTKWLGVCPACGYTYSRNRRCNGYHCDRTKPLVWKINPKFLAQSA